MHQPESVIEKEYFVPFIAYINKTFSADRQNTIDTANTHFDQVRDFAAGLDA